MAYAYLGVGVPAAEVQTIAVLTLTLSALWVLVILARPFTRITTAVVVAAYASLAVVLSLPSARDFLRLELPPPELILVAVASSAVASVVLELLHRRRVRRPRASTSRMLG